MEIQNAKLDLLIWLANLQDKDILNKLVEFRKQTEAGLVDVKLEPMSKEELIARALKSEENIKNGEVFDIEELKKEYGVQ